MSQYLTIDQGNTDAKLALWDDDRLLRFAREPEIDARAIDLFLDGTKPEGAIYCSVRQEGTAILNHLGRIARRACRLSADMPLPIAIDYNPPGSLGADRIAAAVGARVVCPDRMALVVDIGTAVTYDVVTADGRFAGGNIVPGMKMRLDALNRYTARLPLLDVPDEVTPDEPLFGTDTPSAMIRGALFGIAGAIAYYASRLPASTAVILTGGNARLVEPLCQIDVIVDPHLVSKGLNRILMYNEDK